MKAVCPKNSGAAYYYEAEVAGENGSMYCDVPFTGVNHAEAVEIEEVKQSNLIAPMPSLSQVRIMGIGATIPRNTT